MTNFLVTLSYLAIGKGLSRLPGFPGNSAQVLNQYVIHVALPALILLKIPELTFTSELLAPALMPWFLVGSSAAAVLLGARLCRWPRETTGALLLIVPLGNTAFLGIPLVTAFFGEEAVPLAIIYDQLGSFPALVTYGSAILAIFSPGSRPSPWAMTKRVITFPPFLALLLALALRPLTYPEFFTALFRSLADTLAPVVITAVGLQLSFRLSREVGGPLVYGLLVKMILAPASALLLATLLDLRGLAVQVAIFQAGMPPMVLAGALALTANLSPRLAAALVGLGILTSFVTLPILYRII